MEGVSHRKSGKKLGYVTKEVFYFQTQVICIRKDYYASFWSTNKLHIVHSTPVENFLDTYLEGRGSDFGHYVGIAWIYFSWEGLNYAVAFENISDRTSNMLARR